MMLARMCFPVRAGATPPARSPRARHRARHRHANVSRDCRRPAPLRLLTPRFAQPFVKARDALLARDGRTPSRRLLELACVGDVIALVAGAPRLELDLGPPAVQRFDTVE